MAKAASQSSSKEEAAIEDKVFDFILGFSKKTLSFPTSEELTEEFNFTGTYAFNVLSKLVKDGRISKTGRYSFRINPQFIK